MEDKVGTEADLQAATATVDWKALYQARPYAAHLWAEFARVEGARMIRVARQLLRDESEAQDLAQDAMIKAFTNLGAFRWESGLKTWVMRILINEGLKRIRRRRVKDRVGLLLRHQGPGLVGQADPERLAGLRQQAEALELALKRLSARQRTAFVLRYLEGLPVVEVADLMGIGAGSVKTHLVRALRQVRANWPHAVEEKPDENL